MMVRKIFEKAGMVPGLQPGHRPAADAPGVGEPAKPRTAPGTMMGFLTAQSAAVHEAEQLKDRVKALEGEAPLRKLDPAVVKASKWANRHEASFKSAEFEQLKAEIASAGGNVQPIKVRPQQVLNGSTPAGDMAFELIFGHRRHRACLELGLPVLAAIEEASDVSLFEQMERENRGRKNLSAWEQGSMYRRALDDGLYPSLRRLAESLSVDVSLVSKSVTLARLPEAVVAAFQSPLEIQFRWAAPLAEAVQKDPDGILARAKVVAGNRGKLSSAEIFDELISGPRQVLNGSTPTAELEITKAGKKAATLTTDSKGRAVIRFEAGALPDAKRKPLAKAIEEFLRG
jgi:ParB family transcriptional regulator, chromosome partitioning protein